MYRIIDREEAEEDLATAAAWYDRNAPGLGREFLRAFRAGVAVLHTARGPLEERFEGGAE